MPFMMRLVRTVNSPKKDLSLLRTLQMWFIWASKTMFSFMLREYLS